MHTHLAHLEGAHSVAHDFHNGTNGPLDTLQNLVDKHVNDKSGNLRHDNENFVDVVKEERPIGLETFRGAADLCRDTRDARAAVDRESDNHTEHCCSRTEAGKGHRVHMGNVKLADQVILGVAHHRRKRMFEELDSHGVGPQVTGKHCTESKHHHRDEHAGRSFVNVFFAFLGTAVFTEEREDDEAAHVDSCNHRREEANHIEGRAHRAAHEQAFENQVLGPEAGKAREADNREEREDHHAGGNGGLLDEPAHLAHILFARERVDHGARTEEEGRLEEGVGEHVEDRSVKGTHARRHEHIAQLADRGVSEDLLDIVLEEARHRGPERRQHTDDSDDVKDHREDGEHASQTGKQVDTRSHHGRGMDKGRNRSRTRHGIGEPSEERNLSGLTRTADKEEETRQREHRKHNLDMTGRHDHLDERREGIVIEDAGAAHRHEAEHTEQEADIAHAVHDERLVRRLAVIDILVPETDEEVRAEAYAFPTEEREEQVIGKHEHDHAEQEQVDVGQISK